MEYDPETNCASVLYLEVSERKHWEIGRRGKEYLVRKP
jgi:hypothetical protein